MLPYSTSVLLLLSVLLGHSSALTCRIGTQRECEAAPFVPGHHLVGQSFDIVKLERKSAYVIDVKTFLNSRDACLLCSNPLQNHVDQKLPSSVVDWRAITQCNADIDSSFHTSVSSLVQAYTSQDTNDWMAGLEIERHLFDNYIVGGAGSKAYKFASPKIKEDRHTFSIHSVTCSNYGLILSVTPALSSEFKRHLEILPSHYNYSTFHDYRQLIHTYGTHYFRLVNLGGRLRRVTSSRTCLSSVNGLTPREAHSCLSLGVAVGLGKEKLSSVQKSCIRVLENKDVATGYGPGLHRHFTEVSGADGWLGEFSISKTDSKAYIKWLDSLKDHPDVVSHSLRPLYELVPSRTRQAGLKAAIEKYLKENAVKKPEEPRCAGHTVNATSNCCPVHASRGTLSVTIIRGWNLFGDDIGVTEGYAKMFYGKIDHKTKMIESNNPEWNVEFNLGKVDTSLALKIEVWDQDPKYDDLLVHCERYLIPGTHTFTCNGRYGNVEVKYRLTCDPHLTGEKCKHYKPSP